jgi:hypothetical protein
MFARTTHTFGIWHQNIANGTELLTTPLFVRNVNSNPVSANVVFCSLYRPATPPSLHTSWKFIDADGDIFENILWRVSPVRGASNQTSNRKRTSCYAKHTTVGRVTTPRSLLCNTEVAALGRHATIAAMCRFLRGER